ncbi:chitinase 2-like [Tripterygium wilfordii]|uniref:Chitinase 2-like n=1 Tax=Tripterygium wilfordii TaxID=458696 RepID=A0A7J7DZL1_TRIWF|nr:chitinase 2-like [Tripterygium wilfordii]KAF5751798.1 chitinase 2-like [Tripterygium wilfordii]
METVNYLHHFFLLCFAGLAFIGHRYTDAKVMMEYIGPAGKPVSFYSVPIEDGIDFHFILSFAIDADQSGNPQNGIFSPNWPKTLTPESLADIKNKNPKVKALASLSGWSLNKKLLYWYDPQDPQKWISNAFTSLKYIALKYHLDGIDIDYQNFPKGNKTSFAYCIGELITQLKKEKVISVATIAPYYATVQHYIELYEKYGGAIDYINYQFFTDKVQTPELYLEAFKLQASHFDKEKLLPSFEVDGRGIHGDSFLDALYLLEKNGFEVNGVMIFSADASGAGLSEYYYEYKSQNFLLESAKSKKCNKSEEIPRLV